MSGAAVVTPTHMKLPLNSSLLSSRTLGGTGKTTDLISLHFQTLEGGRNYQVGRQRVPGRRSNVSKRTSTEDFQDCLWNCEQSFCRRTKAAQWLICAERRRQVWRKSAVEVTESERCELVLNAVFYWESVEFCQKRCDMITLRFFSRWAARSGFGWRFSWVQETWCGRGYWCVVSWTVFCQDALQGTLSPFLIGRMFVREPSWKYSAKLVGS